jgi:hypothetical protein
MTHDVDAVTGIILIWGPGLVFDVRKRSFYVDYVPFI